jgi:diguanylate cyclase (GGDEF)-like protein/PAS domain S-box-containing protein
MSDDRSGRGRRSAMSAAQRDLIAIAALVAIALALEIWFDTLGHLVLFVSRLDREPVSEALGLGTILMLAFAAFAWRRWRELRHEVQERTRVEQRSRALFIHANDAILIFEPEREMILDANDRAGELYGLPRAALIGRSMLEFSTDPVRGQRSIDGLLAGGASDSFTFRQRRHDGRMIDIIARASIIDYDGRPVIVTINRDVTAERQAESALRRSERRFRMLFEQSFEAISQIDANGVITYAGPSTFRLTGRTAAEVVGRQMLDFIHPDDVTRVVQSMEESLRSPGGMGSIEFRSLHADGSWRWMEATGTNLLHDPDVGAIVSNYRDITERKRGEEALRASEERFRALVEKSWDGMVVLRRDGTIAYVSPSTMRLLGYRPEDLLDTTIDELIHPEDRFARMERGAALKRGQLGSKIVSEMRVRHQGGEWRWLEVITTNLLEDPAIAGFVVNYRDVTERKAAEAALRESEERYRLLVDQSPDAIAVHSNHRYVYVNDAAVRLFGAERPEEILNRSIYDFIPEGERERFGARIRAAAQAAEAGPPPLIVSQRRRLDGDVRDVESIGIPITYQGQPAAQVVNRDVTERLRSEATLRQQHVYLAALHETTLGLLNRLEITDLLTTVLTRAGALLGAPNGFIVWLHNDDNEVPTRIGIGLLAEDTRPPVHRGEGLIGTVWETSEPLVIDDYQQWEKRRTGEDDLRDRLHAAVAVPLRADGQVIGVISLVHLDPACRFTAAEVELLTRFADLAAIALQNARLYEQLRGSEERYRQLFESNPLPMWVYDVETLRFLAVNAAAVAHYGYSHDEFLAMGMQDIRPPEGIPALREFITNYARQHRATGIWRHRKKNGALIDVETTSYLIDFEHRVARLAVANDITERIRVEQQLVHHALHDTLTGLPNRALFTERLTRALERAKRDPAYRYAVLYLDFDRFKTINDSLGHLEGDRVLIEGAWRLAQCVREQDTLSRLGGDEFVLLLEELADWDEPIDIAHCLSQSLSASISLQGQDVTITASIGIVLGAARYHRPDELLRDADIAMYQAKVLRAGEPVVFDAAMHARAVARLHLENELRRAVEREEFVLDYQPIVALGSGTVVGLEALVRWQHPEMGIVAPEVFIPIAEETGLIVTLGRWVLRAACRAMRAWDDSGMGTDTLTLSVNVSARELRQPGFAASVRDVLRDVGLAAHRLVLEITESALVEEPREGAETLQALHDMGIRIHLDDFGVGYSSLSYLHRFPLDALKIDRSFISAPGSPAIANRGIVEAIIALARTLGIAVIAEGIESAEQESELRSLHCLQGQGNLFSAPISGARVNRILPSIVPATPQNAPAEVWASLGED